MNIYIVQRLFMDGSDEIKGVFNKEEIAIKYIKKIQETESAEFNLLKLTLNEPYEEGEYEYIST